MTVFSTAYLLTNLEQINRLFSEFLSGQGVMCYLIYSFFIRTLTVVSKDNLILLNVIKHLRKQYILCVEICTGHTHAYVQSFVSFCVLVFCTGHSVMVPLNFTYLHCLQHSLLEHLFNLFMLVV